MRVPSQGGGDSAHLRRDEAAPKVGHLQAWLPEFRVANLLRDRALLELAKVEAARFAAKTDPTVSREETAAVWARLKQQWQRRYGLAEAW